MEYGTQNNLLETKHLTKNFDGLCAVNNVALSIQKGELSSIIGPNGAGKTTLFNVITKIFAPTSGQIIFNGEDITKLPPYKICHKGLVRSFQITNIFPNFTVFENVQSAFLMVNKKHTRLFSNVTKMFKDETYEILSAIDLKEQASVVARNLPYGDQRKLEIGIALAFRPILLLLDEPTAGMSRLERFAMADLIQKITHERSLTVVFVEHDMDLVLSISQKLRVMHQGSIIAEGKPEEIKQNEEVRNVYLGEATI